MAFDTTGFFTIVGKYIKTINVLDGYIAATETLKEEIRDEYEAEDLHDLYGRVPGIIDSFHNAVTGTIDQLISDLSQGLMLDRDYVIEELLVVQPSLQNVLTAIHKDMDTGSDTIETSVVSLEGTDQDMDFATGGSGLFGGDLFGYRKLDGVNAPGNGVAATPLYNGLESQLAKTTTVRGTIISAETIDSTTLQLYSLGPETRPYVEQDEEPGPGPILANTRTALNLIGNNVLFDSWNSDNPNSWSMSGGSAGTDWEDGSSAGIGPLQINTVNVTATQQVTGLQHETTYFAAAPFRIIGTTSETGTVGIKMRNLADDTDYMTQQTLGVVVSNRGVAYGFFSLANTVDLDDVYVEVEYTAESVGANYAEINAVTVAPATYYNGLAWAFLQWRDFKSLGGTVNSSTHTFQVANDDSGVIQAFFRKAFNVQLPTADSPSLADSLAT